MSLAQVIPHSSTCYSRFWGVSPQSFAHAKIVSKIRISKKLTTIYGSALAQTRVFGYNES